jgi:YfiH family protein
MAFRDHNQLRFFSFELFADAPLHQGIFTRKGGVSPSPWNSLNTGGMNGDLRENVVENRRRIFGAFGLKVESIFDVWQVHGSDVVVAKAPRPLDAAHQKADAILTDRDDITLFMRFGDCVPIYFYDPIRQVIGIAHAGWQGTVAKIVQVTVKAMQQHYHSHPADILAGIGPSICGDHYEFGGYALELVQKAFSSEKSEVILEKNGKNFFDLWRANYLLLIQAGMKHEHIQISGICTAGNVEDWYSHRAEQGKTGRFGALLALK